MKKIDKEEIINQEDYIYYKKHSYDDEEDSVNLMLGGFIIGIGAGVITGNFMLGTAGSFIGVGMGYILDVFRSKKIEK